MSVLCCHQHLRKSEKTLHCHQNNRLWNSFMPFLEVHGQKYYTLDTPCFCLRDVWIMKPDGFCSIVGICKAICEPICLTSGPVLGKWKCWKCVFVCQLGVRVKGFEKQKLQEFSPEIIHHMRAGDGLLYLHLRGYYKSSEERTSHVFQTSCSLVSLRRTGL